MKVALSAAADDVAKLQDDSREKTRNNITSVKLPRYELMRFEGVILRWQEFWNSLKALIHNNSALQLVDKFNYLKVQLEGTVKDVIGGLDITNANYEVAVKLF